MTEKREKEIREICDKLLDVFHVIEEDVTYEIANPELQCGD